MLGADFFNSPETVRKLGLTDTQTRDIEEILQRKERAVDKLIAEMGMDVPQVVSQEYLARSRRLDERQRTIDKDSLDRIAKLLTPQQRTRFSEMRGRQIDLKKLDEQLLRE